MNAVVSCKKCGISCLRALAVGNKISSSGSRADDECNNSLVVVLVLLRGLLEILFVLEQVLFIRQRLLLLQAQAYRFLAIARVHSSTFPSTFSDNFLYELLWRS